MQQPTEHPLSAAPVEPAIPESSPEYLSWLPATCSAVSLRLFAIDSAIIYRTGDQPGRETLQVSRPSIACCAILQHVTAASGKCQRCNWKGGTEATLCENMTQQMSLLAKHSCDTSKVFDMTFG